MILFEENPICIVYNNPLTAESLKRRESSNSNMHMGESGEEESGDLKSKVEMMRALWFSVCIQLLKQSFSCCKINEKVNLSSEVSLIFLIIILKDHIMADDSDSDSEDISRSRFRRICGISDRRQIAPKHVSDCESDDSSLR